MVFFFEVRKMNELKDIVNRLNGFGGERAYVVVSASVRNGEWTLVVRGEPQAEQTEQGGAKCE